MRTHRSARRATGLLVAAAVVSVDQLTKLAAAHGHAGSPWPARNPAYAFGVIGGAAPLLIAGAVAVLAAFVLVADALTLRFGISLALPALVAGGTIGNTLDRIRLGAARDFIVTPWAIVNVADLAVAAGLLGLVVALLVRMPRRHAPATASAPA